MLAAEARAEGFAPGAVDRPTRRGGPEAVLRATRALAGALRAARRADRALRFRGVVPDAASLARLRAFALARLAADLIRAHGVRVAVGGPVPLGPVVLVSNHLSWIDPLVLASLVPCLPIAKREVVAWPLVGALGRRHGVIFVERGDAASGARALWRARRALAAGVSVLNFAEGTTTEGGQVARFRRGVFGLARLARVAVVPVALRFDDPALAWTGRSAFVPHYLRAIARGGAAVRVRFGHPMTPERYGGAEALACEARAVVEHLLGAP